MSDLHSILQRQLRRVGIEDPDQTPDPEAWSKLLERVSFAYESADDDRYRLERSLDISSMEMEELHDQLIDERDKLHAVLAALSDGICYMDRNWEIRFLNAAGERMLDVSHDQGTGRQIFEFLSIKLGHEDEIDGPTDALEQKLQESTPFGFDDCHIVNHCDNTFPAKVTFNPMLRDDEVVGIVLKITDITSEKQAQSMIKKAQGVAEEAKRAKEAQAAFLANMSHELRTPLNAIIGYSELVTEDAEILGYSEVVPDLEKIQLAGKHLVSLISDVLDMSKIQAGKVELEIDTFKADDLVNDVVVMLEPDIAASGNELIVEKEETLGTLRSDRTKIRQILSNLLNNAGKFTEEGTVHFSTSTYEHDRKTWFQFTVRDTGIGIPEEKIPRLFEAFTQEDESTTRKYGGTGLGLAICKNYCEVLGGRIEIESERGVGTTFVVHLPSGVAHGSFSSSRRDDSASVASPRASIQTAIADSAHRGENVALLVIDDEPSVHEMITRYLTHRSVVVHSAMSGDEGLQMARQLKPDAIVVDVLMSEMSGWDVLSKLKSDPTTSSIPVIVGSILDEESKAFSLGADEYLVKPIDRESLDIILNRYAYKGTPRVLIVEDDDDLRHLLQRRIDRTHWDVDTAAHGGEAHQYLQEHRRPDLILLDLMMPEVDGFDLLQILHKNPEWQTIPIVILTAMELTNREKKLLDTHVRQILHKGSQSEHEFLDNLTELIDSLDSSTSAVATGVI